MIVASAYFLNSLSLLSHSEGGFGFNTDIFETNIVNLAILWFGLFTFLKDPLASSLSERKSKIQIVIQEAEEQLEQAKIRLAEAEKQSSQVNLVLDPINRNAEISAQKLRDAALEQGKSDIISITVRAKNQIFSLESQIKEQVFSHVIDLALKRVQSQLETNLTQDMQVKIIDANISRLGGLS
jgi:F-type H+-transporting ATPase subunit b